MSARDRLERVGEILDSTRDLVVAADDQQYEPGIERLARLLEAIAEAQAAGVEATLEAAGLAAPPSELRTITRRGEVH